MDLNAIRMFAAVVQKGSFTAAAGALGAPKSTVSRRVSSLERELGTRLLHRTTRRLSLTEAGAAFYDHGARALEEMAAAERAVGRMRAAPRGRLGIATSVEFGEAFLGGLVADFLADHPEVNAEMFLSNDLPEFLDEGIDVAVRIGPLADSALMARHLGTLETVLCAAPGYLAARGVPSSPHDLANHDLLLFPPGAREGRLWRLRGDGTTLDLPVAARLSADNLGVIHAAARRGLGIALLPLFRCAPDLAAGDLAPVLRDWRPPREAVHAVYAADRDRLPKVSRFLEFLARRLDPPPWMAGE